MKPGLLIRVFWLDPKFNKFGSRSGLSRQVGFGSGFCPDTKIQKLENNELFIQHFDIMRVLNGGSGSGSVHLHPDPQPWMKLWAWFKQKKESLDLCMAQSFFLHKDPFAHLRFCELSRTLVMPQFTCFRSKAPLWTFLSFVYSLS